MSRTFILIALLAAPAQALAAPLYTVIDYGTYSDYQLNRYGGISLSPSGQVSTSNGFYIDSSGNEDIGHNPPSGLPYAFEDVMAGQFGVYSVMVTGPGGVQEVVPFLYGVNAATGVELMQELFGTAVNSSGELIGSAEATLATGGANQGFFWQFSPTGVAPNPTLIPNISGFTGLTALSLNDSGQIVGYSTGPNNLVHAFLFNGQSTLDLNNVIPPSLGLNLYAATGISNSGQIVGLATDQAGNIHEIELIPTAAPEPTTLACLVAGSLAFAATRRLVNRKSD